MRLENITDLRTIHYDTSNGRTIFNSHIYNDMYPVLELGTVYRISAGSNNSIIRIKKIHDIHDSNIGTVGEDMVLYYVPCITITMEDMDET